MDTSDARILENPVTGERYRWQLTAAQTNGILARAEVWVRPGGGVVAHIHPRSEERVELLSGRMELEVGRRRLRLAAGDRACVPAGVAHRWRNSDGERLHFFVELDPPLRFEEHVEALFGLARAGKVDRRGRVRLMQLAVESRALVDEAPLARLPLWIQRLRLDLLAPVARILGRHPIDSPADGRAVDL